MSSALFDIKEFSKAAEKFKADSHKKLVSVAADAMLILADEVIRQTPKDSGQLKSNWFLSSNSKPMNKTDDTMQANRFENKKMVLNMKSVYKVVKEIYLTNNQDYINVVEFGGYPNPPKNPTGKTINGFSTQAPKGMLRINVAKFDKYFEQAKRMNE